VSRVDPIMGVISRRRVWAIAAGLLLAIGLETTLAAEAGAGHAKTTRVSASSHEAQGNELSVAPTISAHGRFVAFLSDASNLIRRDTNGDTDIFIRDRKRGTTRRVSVSSQGGQAHGDSYLPAISADGRFVAFVSMARNLVARPTNGRRKVFVHDRKSHRTRLVSVNSAGKPASGGTNLYPAISANGRFVAFASAATNLVRRDTNGRLDIFVHDRKTGRTRRVSVSSSGEQANRECDGPPAISANGRFVSFASDATNLVPGDTNREADVFVHDLRTGKTSRVNVSSTGEQANDALHSFDSKPAISADGRFVAFESDATNLVPGLRPYPWRVFVHDRTTGKTSLASVRSSGNPIEHNSYNASISANGRFVAFHTGSVYVHDRRTGKTKRVSVGSSGEDANSTAWLGAISADGRFVSFDSTASNLVPRDTNDAYDVFVRGPLRWGSR
jgi:Tol biopolymer transport system component